MADAGSCADQSEVHVLVTARMQPPSQLCACRQQPRPGGAHLCQLGGIPLELGHDGSAGCHGVQIPQALCLVKVGHDALLNLVLICLQLPDCSFHCALQFLRRFTRMRMPCKCFKLALKVTCRRLHAYRPARGMWLDGTATSGQKQAVATMGISEQVCSRMLCMTDRAGSACLGVGAVCACLAPHIASMLAAAQDLTANAVQLSTHCLHAPTRRIARGTSPHHRCLRQHAVQQHLVDQNNILLSASFLPQPLQAVHRCETALTAQKSRLRCLQTLGDIG